MNNFEAESKLKSVEPVAVEAVVNELIRLQSTIGKYREALDKITDKAHSEINNYDTTTFNKTLCDIEIIAQQALKEGRG